ncbi:MAG: Gfo/Idh/MocA family oxidoreductase [Planctomycetaceae bacterium]|jgi:myo-inositol 2-dehydrogenase / D-chiro-inositol 1-dehydrogenase|nr:Gfo/Idh/MocA family oxidoreductase [Planctomycetaceae bacterium]MBT6157841.1 Gfo/Idh/MocA family oxidoreductase [Planctomycetaceae bacterium]MBT6487089.1 Gfo/Idh/MocA family oxidoreductase [Planctomycetaceae bacterium]
MTKQTNNSTSRRDFMKTSSVAAVGTGLLGNLAMTSGAFASGDETIRVGLVGCGGRGSRAAVQALSTKGRVQLVAMADAFDDQLDSSLKRITAATKSLGADRVNVVPERRFSGFDAYRQVIDSDIDLVILATPPGFRPIHFEAAVNAGKHVFMEKPVATDAPGIRKVLAAVSEAKKKNLKVGVGLQRHHQAKYIETIDRIQNGAIGDVVALRVYWNSGGVWEPRRSREQVSSEMEYQMRNWYYYNWLCGDHIVEQHIHNLDVGNWIKGGFPVRASGMGGREVRKDKRYGEIFDHHAVEYEYEDGTRMFSQCRHIRNVWNSVSEHAHGAKGVATVSGGSLIAGDDKWRFNGDKSDPYQVEHDDLFAAIRNNEKYNEGEQGAMSTMTAILGRMATYSGKVIDMDKALHSEISIMPKRFTWDADPQSLPNADGEYAIPVPGVTKVV